MYEWPQKMRWGFHLAEAISIVENIALVVSDISFGFNMSGACPIKTSTHVTCDVTQ